MNTSVLLMEIQRKIKILMVEDSEDDELLLIRAIKREGFLVKHLRVETETAMIEALLNQEWDLILSDYSLPSFNGLIALSIVQKMNIDIPFIIISGVIKEEIAVDAMKAGANDYLMKGNLKKLGPAIERSLTEASEQKKRKEAEEKLQLIKRQKELYQMMSQHFLKNNLQKILSSLELYKIEKQSKDLNAGIHHCIQSSKIIDRVNQIFMVLQSDFKNEMKIYSLFTLIKGISNNYDMNFSIDKFSLNLSINLDHYIVLMINELFSFLSQNSKSHISVKGDKKSDKNFFILTIKDNKSISLPKDVCTRLKSKISDDWDSHGHYLGLTLASVITQHYGGRLIINPQKDLGNEFIIEFPLNLLIQENILVKNN